MATITPFLWFDGDLAEPIAYYASIFPGASPAELLSADGPIFAATIEVCGQQLMLLNGGPMHAGFTEAISLFVSVDTQDEIDDLWHKLTVDGGEPGQCGWLKDRYGLSWQVVPADWTELLTGPDRARADRAMQAVFGMRKIDVAAVYAAADQT